METDYGIEEAKQAALKVLLHNMRGPFEGLPRTAGWGYPEPYTRDLLLSLLGIAVSGNSELIQSLRTVLKTLAKNQSPHGHIPSLVHACEDRGASDTTPLFLLAVAIYRRLSRQPAFLEDAVNKALLWMNYQSPSDRILVAQQPTSDWRDEQWVLGYGLYVNTLVYCFLRLLKQHKRACVLHREMEQFVITKEVQDPKVHEGLKVKYKPYYALWSYKVLSSERFDLLGNCLAILSGIASPTRTARMIEWIEDECEGMRRTGLLAADLPPNFFPFVRPGDPDWHARDERFNKPGDYHNGGIWPFICGFYVAALVAARKLKLAQRKLAALTQLVRQSRERELAFGFNEWHKAQTGKPMGQNWQTWSAALYLYAAACVQQEKTPYFDEIRNAC
jgi:hypothetical protein